jgi:hypothetical protein
MQDADTAWKRAYANRTPHDILRAAYQRARAAHWAAVAKLLIATGKVE